MSGSLFVKQEPEDFDSFLSSQQLGRHFPASGANSDGIDPSRLTIKRENLTQNNIMNTNNFGMGHSYGMGNAVIPDDDLEQLVDDAMFTNTGGFNGFEANVPNSQASFFQNSGVSMSHQHNVPAQMFSHTPNEAPIQSPFAHENFNYNQYGQQIQYNNLGIQNGSARKMMERQPSDHRSPVTPRIQTLQIGTPDALQLHALNQQAKMTSTQWDGTPGSGQSWMDSPVPSPHAGHGMHHPPISEIMNKHHSVPTKMEGGHSASLPSYNNPNNSQEAKKKRRRESHNLVERRRRDNINERIQDLSKLVPHHRLEDDKVRKHISVNGPMSPHGISPPHATSLLAGGTGRRATAGTITQGLPADEKEKGPNKGDILNGAVAWMRDLMWILYLKDQEQQKMKAEIERLGGSWELDTTEEMQRMMSELRPVVQQTGVDNFYYSRAAGSGLRVPDFTNFAGEALDGTNGDVKIKADPGSVESDIWFQNGGDSGRASLSIKEEDELNGMDMG